MLMDEPFSAVDPVVREQLQDEFLRLQSELGKTILFVTHDIDEAVKIGDLVAVLRVGGTLAQTAAPGTLLADPFDDFVADFVGRDRGYRGLTFRETPRLVPHAEPWLQLGDRPATHAKAPWLLVVDEERRPLGWVEPRRLAGRAVSRDDLHRGGTVARVDGSARSVLDAALSSPSGRGVVVDDVGVLVGTVTAAEVVAGIAAHPGSVAAEETMP
jgi:osmoprotectant transport system ATP-binding protein